VKEFKCKKCGNKSFNIEDRECHNCDCNGVYNDKLGHYEHPLKTTEERTQADEERECEMGHTWNAGCHFYICSSCLHPQSHFPVMEE